MEDDRDITWQAAHPVPRVSMRGACRRPTSRTSGAPSALAEPVARERFGRLLRVTLDGVPEPFDWHAWRWFFYLVGFVVAVVIACLIFG